MIFIGEHKKVTKRIVNNSSKAIVDTQILVLHLFEHYREDHHIVHYIILQQVHLIITPHLSSSGSKLLTLKATNGLEFRPDEEQHSCQSRQCCEHSLSTLLGICHKSDRRALRMQCHPVDNALEPPAPDSTNSGCILTPVLSSLTDKP